MSNKKETESIGQIESWEAYLKNLELYAESLQNELRYNTEDKRIAEKRIKATQQEIKWNDVRLKNAREELNKMKP